MQTQTQTQSSASQSGKGTFDRFSSDNSTVFLVDHSLWLYAIFPGLIFVVYCLLASLTLTLSDSRMCESPVRGYLYLSIGAGYTFVFFLCYLFLFGRPRTRKVQNTFLGVFSSLNLVVTLWGSASLYSSGVIDATFSSAYNYTQPQYYLAFVDFLNSTPCTRTLALRIGIFGLSINYFYFFLLFIALFYTLGEYCCCRSRLQRTEILGIGGIQRTRARKLMELKLAREAGMAIVQEEFMKNMKKADGDQLKSDDQKNREREEERNQESQRLVNRSGWTAATP